MLHVSLHLHYIQTADTRKCTREGGIWLFVSCSDGHSLYTEGIRRQSGQARAKLAGRKEGKRLSGTL